MIGSIKLISGLVLSLTLLPSTLATPHPTTCPRSTTTTNHRTILEPACPTITVDLFRVPIPCPPTPTTLICACPFEPATSTITYGCAGKCCPTVTPTVTKAPKLGCPTGCAAVCHPGTTTTVTEGC